MPRTNIDLDFRIEHLSILDEHGKLDEKLMPDVSGETLRQLHRAMLLSRRFDERLLRLQREGQIGTFALLRGQEAAQIGAVAVLKEEDWVVPSFRETAVAVWRGASLASLIVFNAGYNEGAAIPKDSHDLPIAVPVATQLPHAAGLAYGLKYRKSKQVVMAFFGDGATSEGDFHEALNFAGVFNLPAVFVCQNNQWAISLPREKQTRSKTLAQKAIAYGFPGVQVDGNDVLAVYAAAEEAVKRARGGGGPTLIECVTYRMSLHTTADDPKKYRSEKEVEKWEKRDPIERLQKLLMKRDLLSKKALESLEEEIEKEIDSAWKEAKSRVEELGDPLVMFDCLYAERPPYLEEQRQAYRDYLESETENGRADDD